MQRWQQIRHALGSQAILTLVSDLPEPESIFAELWAHVSDFEARFSRFRESSELTAVNRTAGTSVKVSSHFADVLGQAIDMVEISEHLFNPLILPALQASGYAGSWPHPSVASAELDMTKRRVANVSEISLDGTQLRLPADVALEFGGCGKGILLDELSGLVQGRVDGYCFSLGGDILCAGRDLDGPWKIGVESITTTGLSFVENADYSKMAVATSGVTKRRGEHNGRTWHHIIDPRTATSAETDIATVTVCAATGLLADVLAKCAVIVGSNGAERYLLEHGITTYLIQYSKKSGLISQLKSGIIK